MKVLFDNLGFEDQAFGGVTRYLTEIMRHFPHGVEAILPVVETSNVYLQDKPFRIPAAQWSFQRYFPHTNFRGKTVSFKLLSRLISPFIEACELKNRHRFRQFLETGDFDVLHITRAHMYGKDWTSAVGRKPIVVTIHDLIPDIIQGLERFRRERLRVIPLVTRFIAVSENTKNDLVSEYGVDPELIDVVYHGPSGLFSGSNSNEGKTRDYILYVGGRGSYKNFVFFATTIAPWLRDRPMMRLICTGLAFQKQERRLLDNLGILSQCEARFFPTSELPSLYANAFAFIFPSLYEGFGIPILDAFEMGCPTILNRTSCFPEIGGDAALYFKNGDSQSLLQQLDRLESEPTLRENLRERGKRRVQYFSWEKAANETVAIYKKALESFPARH